MSAHWRRLGLLGAVILLAAACGPGTGPPSVESCDDTTESVIARSEAGVPARVAAAAPEVGVWGVSCWGEAVWGP